MYIYIDPCIDLYEHLINLEEHAVIMRCTVWVVRVVGTALAAVNPIDR